jgi:hypothetical protein
MTRPSSTLYSMNFQNPHASAPLTLPVLVLCNTSDSDLLANIHINSGNGAEWIGFRKPNPYTAILVGGGPSVADHIEQIAQMQADGGMVFAMNGAATFLLKHGIRADYQVVADAKPETATLVEPKASRHLFASQVDPACFAAVPGALLWHLHMDNMEDAFPQARKARGGYALVGGGAAVGNSACALAYVMGYRTLHLFGYDSSHRGEASHAYDQPMNAFIPVIDVDWAGKSFRSSVAMKAQAEKFMITGQALKQEGVAITVHGEGLLPTMWNTPIADMTERDKYRLMWQVDAYRDFSPGERVVTTFLEHVQPDGLVIDFGCGTGRAALFLAKMDIPVLLVDFADNCRDEEAINLPFLEWDLTLPIPARAKYGLCTDVMEHIPTKDVVTVLSNIMEAAETVMFHISTVKDAFGVMLGTDLHLTVRSHEWWLAHYEWIECEVLHQYHGEISSTFIVTRKETPS